MKMPKFSASDPRYNDLSYNEAKRQATRDNMLYNQMKANGGTDDIEYGHSLDPFVNKLNSSKLLFIWIMIFVFSIVFLPMYAMIKKELPVDLGNIPYYVVGGILVIIPIISIIKGAFNNKSNAKKRKEIEQERPNIEKQIRKLQKEWDDMEYQTKLDKQRQSSLELDLRLGGRYGKDIDNIEKELKKIRDDIYNREEKQIELEEKIEELENKIY